MYVIPVVPATLDLISVLNYGVRPTMMEEPMFFIYSTDGRPAEIITKTKFYNMSADDVPITIYYYP